MLSPRQRRRRFPRTSWARVSTTARFGHHLASRLIQASSIVPARTSASSWSSVELSTVESPAAIITGAHFRVVGSPWGSCRVALSPRVGDCPRACFRVSAVLFDASLDGGWVGRGRQNMRWQSYCVAAALTRRCDMGRTPQASRHRLPSAVDQIETAPVVLKICRSSFKRREKEKEQRSSRGEGRQNVDQLGRSSATSSGARVTGPREDARDYYAPLRAMRQRVEGLLWLYAPLIYRLPLRKEKACYVHRLSL